MLGDGIRRSLATVTKEERDLLRDAMLQLNQELYSPGGSRTDFPAGHVSKWFKQDEIHQSSHVHGCPAFLPWHREMLNRFEALLREIDPRLSLHYWDWNLDPSNMPDGEGGTINLFDAEFMGNADGSVNGGAVGEPLLSAGFYDPTAANYRDDLSPVRLTRPSADPTTFSYPDPSVPPHQHYNPADPPQSLTRSKQAGAPPVGDVANFGWPSDHDLITAPNWETFRDLMYGVEQGTTSNTDAHGAAHGYIGGSLGDAHLSFRDPFVFFMHSNIDRLWAMWQRQPGFAAQRLDPAQAYGSEESSTGNGDVEFGDPSWGILSPLEPWAGYSAQTPQTGEITNLWPIRPWFAPENEQNLPANQKNSKDLSVVIPPSYDTAPHSSYIVANQDTFSTAQAALSLTFAKAIYVIYEGFQPREIGTPTATNPAISFTIGGNPVTTIHAVNPQVLLEDPNGATDVPQRITIVYDIAFDNTSAFPVAAGAETVVMMEVDLDYTVGGTGVATADHSSAELLLVNQPSPFMVDIDPTIPPPGPANPYWLSTDTRVFHIKQGDPLAGIPQGNDPLAFVTGLVNHFNSLPNDNNHPFLTQLIQDETASAIELAPTLNGQAVFNYAIAKIRYRGDVPAQNVSAFFRTFKTMVSALDYDHTSGATGNYRRSGDTPGSVPLLGIQSNEIASIPFFANPRINTQSASMTTQTDHAINTQISFAGTGQEEVVYCGVWLDINDIDPTHQRFPFNPGADPGGVDGPYQGQRLTIQQLVAGLHYCLVTELFYWPPGTAADPIPPGATPASSDRLAQRNLTIDQSGNPGWPSTHTVEHTLIVTPSNPASMRPTHAQAEPARQSRSRKALARKSEVLVVPDELMIQWGNFPRDTEATLYFPEIEADEILRLSLLRQSPAPIEKVDEHTIKVAVAEASFIPLPARPEGNLAGLLTLTLPAGVRVGQLFKMNVSQCSGVSTRGRARHTRGAFQFNVPVRTDPEVLSKSVRNLALLRYVQETIPHTSRWHPIFTRWLDGLAKKVSGLGGDPNKVRPSATGGDEPSHHQKRPSREVCDDDLLRLNIPWDECEVEGELELKMRFRRK